MDNEKLINTIFKRRPLWDRHSKNYNNRDTTRRLWAEVSSIMGVITADIKRKWGNLRDQFRKEYIRLNKLAGYVDDYDTKGKSSWAYYDMLLFLTNQINLQGNVATESVEYNKNLTSDESVRVLPASEFVSEYLPPSPQQQLMMAQSTTSPLSLPPPTPSPHLERTFMSEFTSQSGQPIESNQFGKRPLYMDDKYLDIERKKLQLLASTSNETYANDPDRNFLMSLLPYLTELPRSRKMQVQQKLLQVFIEEDNRVTTYRYPCVSIYSPGESNRPDGDSQEGPSNRKDTRLSPESITEPSIDIKQSPQSSPLRPSTESQSQDNDEDNTLLAKTPSNQQDGYDAFGAFVASELRALRNDINLVKSTKKQIQLLMLDGQEKQAATKRKTFPPPTVSIPRPVKQVRLNENVKIKTECVEDGANNQEH